MPHPSRPALTVAHISHEIELDDVANAVWENGDRVFVDCYWSGAEAPAGRAFSVRMLWSDSALYVQFEANQAEPLVVSAKPDLAKKTMGLWDRDVCEIFVAPDSKRPKTYFEFEAAPTGEWLDVAIDLTSGTRLSDWTYTSGMETSAQIEPNKLVIVMTIPWKAFGKMPKSGDVWLGNILRCVGKDPGCGYLAWSPTLTEKPDFHVPEKFGEFIFQT